MEALDFNLILNICVAILIYKLIFGVIKFGCEKLIYKLEETSNDLEFEEDEEFFN